MTFDGKIDEKAIYEEMQRLMREREKNSPRGAILYVHGKGGSHEEAEWYAEIFKNYRVIGIEYDEYLPWKVRYELVKAYDFMSEEYDDIYVIGNSIGAYFAMDSFRTTRYVEHMFLISPIIDMEKIIMDMMSAAGISEEELSKKKRIITADGELISYRALRYVREHPIKCPPRTDILCAAGDTMTSPEELARFVQTRASSALTVMEGGEHYFHTEEQLAFLRSWLERSKDRYFKE